MSAVSSRGASKIGDWNHLLPQIDQIVANPEIRLLIRASLNENFQSISAAP